MSLSEIYSRSVVGIARLERFWERVTRHQPRTDPRDWGAERVLMDGLGLAVEETLQYLAVQQPTLNEFEQWILERNDGHIEPLRIERINATLNGQDYSNEIKLKLTEIEDHPPVFTANELEFWEEHGYVLLHDAISPTACRAVEAAIWEFLGMDRDDPESWYVPSDHGIMRQFFHHPALEVARRSQRVHKAFAQIWDTSDLWMTVDRVSFNPPERASWEFTGPHLHWDTSLTVPVPFGVSGLIYLTDTEANQGAFTCVPGFHRRIDQWLSELPSGADPRKQDLHSLSAMPIAGKAGDLIIWHKALPHGSRPNTVAHPRIVQYLSMHPAPGERPAWK